MMKHFLQKHPGFTRTLVLGYTAFLCCLFFPLGSSPPLHRVILFGLMVLCLVEAYGPGRERDVFFRVLAAAAAGLLGDSARLEGLVSALWLLPDLTLAGLLSRSWGERRWPALGAALALALALTGAAEGLPVWTPALGTAALAALTAAFPPGGKK